MRIVVIGRDDDLRGAALAGAGTARDLESVLADPSVALVLVPSSLGIDSDKVVVIPEGDNADAGKHRGDRGRGA